MSISIRIPGPSSSRVLTRLTVTGALVLAGLILGYIQPGTVAAGEATFEHQVAGIPLSDEGGSILEPWTGGLLAPRPKLADLDADGDVDMMIVQGGGGITYYRNEGDAVTFAYRWVTDNFQEVDAGTWATLADIDADGDLDLFTDGVNAVVFHRNNGNAQEPLWELEDPAFQGIDNTGSGNTPSFVDLDDDGDLDYLEMEQNFGTARMFRNDGTPQVPDLVFVTNEYGCIDTFDPGAGGRLAEPQHGVSVISTGDIDDDDDIDVFIGDIFNPNLWFFRNDPGPEVCYTRVTQEYLPFENGGMNQTELADLDADGDLDMVVGEANQNAEIDNLVHLQNDGTPQEPEHNVVTMNLIPALDRGKESRPALGDLDGDGDLDLYLGAKTGDILTLVNTGGPTDPEYLVGALLQDAMQNPIDVGVRSAPELIDWEGDGDLDLFAGTGAGRVLFYRNDGTPSASAFVLVDTEFTGVRADFNAVPALGDLDADGDLDVMVGEFGTTTNPRLFYMRNDGSTDEPIWVQVSDNTDNTFVFAERVFTGNLAPELFDWDGDDDLDLFLGETDGNINFYRNVGPPQVFQFELEDEVFAGARIGRISGPCLGDVDGDGDDDLFIGEQSGGIDLFRNTMTVPVELVRYEAIDRGDRVELHWETGREFDHLGFHIDRGLVGEDVPIVFTRLTDRPVRGASPYRFVDRSPDTGARYEYRLVEVDRAGDETLLASRRVDLSGPGTHATPEVAAQALRVVSIPGSAGVQLTYRLAVSGHIQLDIYGAHGRLVRRLVESSQPGGAYTMDWDGRDHSGRRLPGGVYFAELETDLGRSLAKFTMIH